MKASTEIQVKAVQILAEHCKLRMNANEIDEWSSEVRITSDL